MFGLKNITPFSEFKKMYEAVDVGTEFSNTTGFKESLIGRATFGLFRKIKDGINLIRLEYFKRKLENEYFVGVLRYCKAKGIDLKNPQPLQAGAENPNTNEENVIVKTAEGILQLRFNVVGWDTALVDIKAAITSGMTQIDSGLTEHQDFQLLRDQLIPNVQKINDNFIILNGLTTIPQNIADIIKNISDGKNAINLIQLASPSPSVPALHYTLIDAEKNIITKILGLTTNNVPVKTTLNGILVDSYNFNDEMDSINEDYDILNEKVGNGSGTGIAFILGDEISKQGIGKFLKDQGVNNVEDINFEKLASIFTDQMRKDATNSVNKNAIIGIAANTSNIIYHVTKTPDDKGINPGTGGGVTDTPTGLMKPWQKKVAKVKGEFSSFLNVDEIDPLTIKGVSEYTKNPKNADQIKKDSEISKEQDRIFKIIKHGSPDIKDNPLTNFGVMRTITKGQGFTGPVFKMESSTGVKVYKYVGSLDFDKMISGLGSGTTLNTDDTTRQKFWFSNRFGTFVPYLKAQIKSPKGTNTDLIGIYFVFLGGLSTSSTGDPKTNKVRIFYVYGPAGSYGIGIIGSVPTFELWALDNSNKLIEINPTTTKIDTTPTFDLGVGKTFEVNSPLKDNFNDTVKHVTPKFLDFVRFKT